MTETFEPIEYDMPTDFESVRDAEKTNEAVASLLSGSKPPPAIGAPPDGTVTLPGGLMTEDGVVRDAVVRELNGEDEEALAKASGHPLRYMQALLRGVETIGGEPVNNKILRSLLIGDREELILAIRVATFGDEIEFVNNVCPHCDAEYDVSVVLSTIPRRVLDDPEIREFEVALRNSKAHVRLPDGDDQWAVMEDIERNNAERNTILLSRALIDIDGKKVNKSKDVVRHLGLADRKTLLMFLEEAQPGPLYNEVDFTHDICGKKVPIIITVGDLFRELQV